MPWPGRYSKWLKNKPPKETLDAPEFVWGVQVFMVYAGVTLMHGPACIPGSSFSRRGSRPEAKA